MMPWEQEDVAAFFKCDVKTVQRMEKAGLIVGVPVPVTDGARPIKRYDEAEIRAVWDRLVAEAKQQHERARAGQPPVRVAGRLARRAVRLSTGQESAA